ncbi:MAG: hypothetical protein U0Q12_16430 [Vicinamibacterales bacterium]
MTELTALWLPILVSSIIVFLASSVLHMALPWHRGDFLQMPGEAKVMDALRPFAIPPGDYMVPRPASMNEMGSTEFAARLEAGPVMVVTILPNGRTPMGRYLALWFVYIVVVGVVAAYVASRALGHDATYLHVFRFAGTTAFVAYSGALWQATIWYRRSVVTTLKSTIDGLVYGLLTAGTFGWLWPR